MKKRAHVFIRKDNVLKNVEITDTEKPEIATAVINKWQNIIDLIAKILNVPSGLIMKISEDSMQVFAKSNNKENPYKVGEYDKLGHGLYCETVIGTNSEVLVHNASKNDEWNDNPDIRFNMISYYGLPLQWPDKEFFGTICVLDNKENAYNNDFKQLVAEFKLSIEKDLELLCQRRELKFYAEMDSLTCVYNRRKLEDIISNEFSRSKRNANAFSIVIFDLNEFKGVNDTQGHDVGDRILKAFASSIKKRIRSIDSFGRWGGDEFILVCPDTDKNGARILINNIKEPVKADMDEVIKNSGFSFGISDYSSSDDTYLSVLKRADEKLYLSKKHRYTTSSRRKFV